MFRFSLPLQDLVNVELQPEIYFRWARWLLYILNHNPVNHAPGRLKLRAWLPLC